MGTRRIKSPEKLEAERAARKSARRESVAERTNRLKSYIADRDARRRRRALEKEVNEVIRGTEAHAAVTRAIEAGENPREAL